MAKSKSKQTSSQPGSATTATAVTATATATSKKKSKWRLGTTRVKKVKEIVNGFQEGHLIRFDADAKSSKYYQIRFKLHSVPEDQEVEEKEESWTEAQVAAGIELHKALSLDNLRVAKDFEVEGQELLYEGTVVSATHDEEGWFYNIAYDDGDAEEFDPNQLKEAQELWKSKSSRKKERKRKATSKQTEKKKTKSSTNVTVASQSNSSTTPTAIATPTPTAIATPSGRRGRKAVKYVEDSDSDDEEPTVVKKKRRRSAPKPSKPLPDDSDFEAEDMESDEESLEADMEEEEGGDDDGDEEEEEAELKSKKKARSTKSTTIMGTKKSLKSVSSQQVQEEFQKKLKKDMDNERPKNNPQKLPDEAYVDPVGVDPTDGIVEGIIGAQVRKIGALLLQTIAHEADADADDKKKTLTFPIQLQTACSGTDAPSMALGLVQETLDKLFSRSQHGFDYSHVMSCEIVPFKQAFIARNFPGGKLFPDIVNIADKGKVVDVYGQEQTIPDGNLFVAGTSCKDFSMLKTRDRQDIEDKGTSGETFLAAVEFLEEKQPPVAIFENVDGAPWGKMAEYIEGKVKLEFRNTTKAIKDSKGKADADNLLIFSVNENCQYVAEEIPRQVGIRAGAIVEGYVKQDQNAKDVTPIEAPPEWLGKQKVTLKQMAKQHGINLDADTLVLGKKARYCTQLVKVDTKNYGLPQTRNRKYLFIWRSDDPDDDLGEYFQEILNHLKTPLLHSMDAFLLPETHDRIRCFREALRSGPGLSVHRERAKELDFWDFEEARIKDVTCHLAFRAANGIEERSRYLTKWDTRGRKQLAPTLWPELFDCWNMRRLDMVDCFAAAAVRDTVSRDPLHHSFTWDISQNVTRAPFRSATVGVCGCVTPGGELVLPHRGRTVMGYEKLLLQGIPFSRLLLGPETEVQLSDLAGNAMSVPVVCATMLAALCAPELRRQRKKSKTAVKLSDFALSEKYDSSGGTVLAERGDVFEKDGEPDCKTFRAVFGEIANNLAQDAFRSSVLCTCESSGTSTRDSKILECTSCGFAVCHACSDRYQMASHSLSQIDAVCTNAERPDSHVFERQLRCAVPSVLRLSEGWEDHLCNGNGLESYTFQLQQTDRKRGHWLLIYGAWEDFGSGRQVAEIRVRIGRIGTLDKEVGVSAFVRCFEPALRHDDPVRGHLSDSARIFLRSNSQTPAQWEVPGKKRNGSLSLDGSGEFPSQRVLVGLNDTAYKSFKGFKPQKQFIPSFQGKSRNNHLGYHKQWRTFPEVIEISGDSNGTVNGRYAKQKCEQTVVSSALWRRDSSGDKPAMYLYIRPDVDRSALDVAVISPTPCYRDGLEVCELHDWIPENSLTASTQKTKVSFLDWANVSDNLKVDAPTPVLSTSSEESSFHKKVTDGSEESSSEVALCEMNGLPSNISEVLLEFNPQGNEDIDLFGRSGTRNAKRLSIIAAPSLVKSAAEEKLSLTMSKWYTLPRSLCPEWSEIHMPLRPVEMWRQKENGSYERHYDAERSTEYYNQLQKRPPAFRVKVDRKGGKMVVCMNPYVAAHRAAVLLGGEAAGAPTIDYCLSELSSMGEPDTRVFRVPNSSAYEETAVPGMALPLYKRQKKALSRMIAIEEGSVLFSEEERSEHVLPGVGWCMIARAAKKTPLRGGCLGDAIGSGKTAITIALIMARASSARSNRDISKGRSSATLVVVPPGLVSQWDDERLKFTKSQLKCLIISDTATLQKKTVKEMCSVDVVIVPAGIIEEEKGKLRPYTANLSSMAGTGNIPPAPIGYSQREAPTIEGTWIRNMASGPEIYVGNKGKQSQRDAQAYYGHCYSNAILKLRTKTFRPADKGVPLEYFTWERIVIDECHQTLVTGKKDETTTDDAFKEKARRGAREFLGVAQTDIRKRPLIAATAVWGLTGTPLLETEARVTELANLMGGTYLTGGAHHWRKEERESGRDLFLNNQEGVRSREYRCAIQESCHAYVSQACQRNRGEKLNVSLTREQINVNLTATEGAKFLEETKDYPGAFALNPDQLVGQNTSDILSITASSTARHGALVTKVNEISKAEPDTKIIIFANGAYGGYRSAAKALSDSKTPFCQVKDETTVQEQNDIISWFRHVDATDEDRARPRVLLLSFEQAAGHNLQEACHHVILYDPMYSGSDAVADASVEEQAIGRVMRQGQKYDVTVTRIVVRGVDGERCLDDWIVDRNLDENVLAAATSNFD